MPKLLLFLFDVLSTDVFSPTPEIMVGIAMDSSSFDFAMCCLLKPLKWLDELL